ncbi:MAG: ribonuclease III [Myxococcota bacterium]
MPPADEGSAADLEAFGARLGHRFARPELLEQALTHSSRAHEVGDRDAGNERLEFLGDAVLGLVVAERLMRAHPHADEGELTQARAEAVNEQALAERARALGLDALVRLSRGERRQGGRAKDSILANAFEALLGALYLDGGLEVARAFLARELGPALVARDKRERDPKTALQELLQAAGREPPRYATVAQTGPPHARQFSVEVRAGDALLGVGSGSSKRLAEQAAAREALAALPRVEPAERREKLP